jgi:hypothetical protein
MDILLKAKPWQLFLIIFLIPAVYQMVMSFRIMSDVLTSAEAGPSPLGVYLKTIPLVMIPFIGVLFAWIWTISIRLQNRLPENVIMKTEKFKVAFMVWIFYFIFFILFINAKSNLLDETVVPIDSSLLWLFIPFQVLFLYFILYCFYFAAKTLKSVELQRPVKSGECIGDMLGFCIYPIGIWFIQPRVNKIADGHQAHLAKSN